MGLRRVARPLRRQLTQLMAREVDVRADGQQPGRRDLTVNGPAAGWPHQYRAVVHLRHHPERRLLPTPWRSLGWRSAPCDTPEPPTGLVATRGDGEVTLSWATVEDEDEFPNQYYYDYQQRRQPGSYGRWTDFAGEEFQQGTERRDQPIRSPASPTAGRTPSRCGP